MKVKNSIKVRRIFAELPEAARTKLQDALEESGQEVLALARVLIPEETGASRLAIRGAPTETGFLMDFGPKAKVIEGQRGPRPFVSPAMKATAKRRRQRNRRAIREAIRIAGGNG